MDVVSGVVTPYSVMGLLQLVTAFAASTPVQIGTKEKNAESK